MHNVQQQQQPKQASQPGYTIIVAPQNTPATIQQLNVPQQQQQQQQQQQFITQESQEMTTKKKKAPSKRRQQKKCHQKMNNQKLQ
jgi:hypothetical protein